MVWFGCDDGDEETTRAGKVEEQEEEAVGERGGGEEDTSNRTRGERGGEDECVSVPRYEQVSL